MNVARQRVPKGGSAIHKRVLSKGSTAFKNLELRYMSVVSVR